MFDFCVYSSQKLQYSFKKSLLQASFTTFLTCRSTIHNLQKSRKYKHTYKLLSHLNTFSENPTDQIFLHGQQQRYYKQIDHLSFLSLCITAFIFQSSSLPKCKTSVFKLQVCQRRFWEKKQIRTNMAIIQGRDASFSCSTKFYYLKTLSRNFCQKTPVANQERKH